MTETWLNNPREGAPCTIIAEVANKVAALNDELGRSLSIPELERVMAGQAPGGGSGGAGAVAPDATAGKDVDNVLDGLLDDD